MFVLLDQDDLIRLSRTNVIYSVDSKMETIIIFPDNSNIKYHSI